MTMPPTETEAQARRRRWISLGEIIAVLALIISALGLYNSWQSGRAGPTEVVEKKTAVPLILKGEVVRGGKAMILSPVESSHTLQSLRIALPGGRNLELGSDGELSARDLADVLAANDPRKGLGSARATITANYVEAGEERSSTKPYTLRYRWESGGLFGGRQLRFTGLARG